MAKDKDREIDLNNFLNLASEEKILLRLYITGAATKSMRAVENIKSICEYYLKGQYELEVIDIYRQPWVAAQDQIVAIPTLIKKNSFQVIRLIGDMTDREKVMAFLGINLKMNGAANKDNY
jgi:circadian clock protein KaiB